MLSEIHDALKEAGFEVLGVSGGKEGVQITAWATKPTAQQEADARTIIQSFDWDRVAPTSEEVRTLVSTLEPVTKQAVLDSILAQWIEDHPKLYFQLTSPKGAKSEL